MHNDVVHQSQFVYLNGWVNPVLSRLVFTPNEPFTVTLAFHLGADEWIEWEFARDLLLTGMIQPAGIGDIRIRPDLSTRACDVLGENALDSEVLDGEVLGEEVLCVDLESPDGYATVEISRRDVRLFLDATISCVRPGTESRYLDIDAVIANLTTARP